MKRILTSFIILTIVTLLCAAQEQPQLGIVNRTQCTGFWRYDFNYQTTDSDGETPIVLSAAIFLSTKFHEKTETRPSWSMPEATPDTRLRSSPW